MKILALGGFGETGFAIALREPLAKLYNSGEHDVLFLGLGYHGNYKEKDETAYPFPMATIGGRDNGEDCLHRVGELFRPDIIWSCFDLPWMQYITEPENPFFKLLPDAQRYLGHRTRNFLHLAYFPVDGLCHGGRLPRGYEDIIRKMDVPVTFSRYTKEAVDRQLGIDVPMIYHGINTEKYFPMDTASAKEKLGLTPGTFIVGMVGVNRERKLFEDLIPAFARFCQDKPEARLILFTVPNVIPLPGSHDLVDLMRQYEVLDRYIDTSRIFRCRDDVMNMVYNAIDVGVLCTQGEGFGLPITHHHAVAKPILVTDCTSCTELTAHEVERLKVRASFIAAGNNTVRYLTDIDDLAAKLELLYHDRSLLEEIGRLGLKRVQEEFDYDRAIMPQWRELLGRLQEERLPAVKARGQAS